MQTAVTVNRAPSLSNGVDVKRGWHDSCYYIIGMAAMSGAFISTSKIYSDIHNKSLVRIEYTNASDACSERLINPLEYYRGRNGHTYIRAYCHLREEERTFRLDRVESWISADENSSSGMGRFACRPQIQRVTNSAWSRPASSPIASTHISSGTVAAVISRSPSSAVQQQSHPFLMFCLVFSLFFGGKWLIESGTLSDICDEIFYSPAPSAGSHSSQQPKSTITETAKTKKQEISPSVPKKRVQYLSYRDIGITAVPGESGYIYSVSQYGLSAPSLRAAHLKLNSIFFQQTTGIQSSALENIYANADADRDGYLIWREIRNFQGMLGHRFKYLTNSLAIRPDEFMARGGGDCEDWALMTCGLLRYWGWTSYAACFFPPGSGEGHAICMVRWQEKPGGLGYYYLDGAATRDGVPTERGYYVPIDYEIVGGSSSAMEENWQLKYFYTPERIYGNQM